MKSYKTASLLPSPYKPKMSHKHYASGNFGVSIISDSSISVGSTCGPRLITSCKRLFIQIMHYNVEGSFIFWCSGLLGHMSHVIKLRKASFLYRFYLAMLRLCLIYCTGSGFRVLTIFEDIWSTWAIMKSCKIPFCLRTLMLQGRVSHISTMVRVL